MKAKFYSAVAVATFLSFLLSSCAGNTSCTGGGAKEEFPILAWYSIPAEDATLERYQELAECGFNINFSQLHRLDDLKVSLDLAQQAGVKVMASCDELESATDSAVAAVKDHPALYGYFLRDEPFPVSFPELAAWAERLKKADGGEHPLYLNLYPNYVDSAALACSYREYVHRFIEEVKLPLVSFDYYPVTFDGVRESWYDNLQIVHEESEAAGLPFWAFALSTAHDPYPLPTMSSLRLELYSALAYGAQGLQYFTYWNPGTEIWNFHEAPINQDKQRSEAYYLVQQMNKEIQARAYVFLGSKVVSIAHLGDKMFKGCKRMDTLPSHVTSLVAGPEGAVVSLLEKDKWNYLVVVSRSLDTPTDLTVSFDTKVWSIDHEGNASRLAKGEQSCRIEPGDALIFKFRK